MFSTKKALLASVVGLTISGLSATSYAANYQVQENDTLWQISKDHGIPLSTLQKANPAITPASLRSGETITIPTKTTGDYIIKQGDTFWKLSQLRNVPLADLLAENSNVDPRNMQVGSTIKIPGAKAENLNAPQVSKPNSTVTVKPEKKNITISNSSVAAPAPQAQKAVAPAPKQEQKQPVQAVKAAPVAAPKAVPQAAPAAKAAPVKATPAAKPAANQITTAFGQAVTFDRVISANATAYTTSPDGNGGFMGRDALGNRVNVGTVAVDPSVIPLGSKLYITGYSFSGLPAGGMLARATDTGGAVKGNKVDLFVPVSQQSAMNFGVQNVKVYILK